MSKLNGFRPQRRNANRHTPRGMGMLERAMGEVGYVAPMTAVADGEIIDGSARREVVETVFPDAEPIVIHHDGTRPIIAVRDDIPTANDPRAKRISIEANRIASVDLDYDPDVLLEYQADGLLDGLWTDDELADVLKGAQVEPGAGGDDFDTTPDEAQTRVQYGDLWQCGEHRVLCGDSTKAEDVARLMQGERAALVFTDPPYNVASENDIVAADCSKAMRNLKYAAWDHDFDILPALDRILEVLSPDATVYVCTSHHLAPEIWAWMQAWANHYSWCVWNKPDPMPSLMKRHWTWNAELVCYATRGRHTFNFPASGHALCVWTIPKGGRESSHPTEKPIAVPQHAIEHSSKVGAIVMDSFGGSGTTLIACQRTGRKCRMMEIEPRYVAVILSRYEAETGDTAVLLERVGEIG